MIDRPCPGSCNAAHRRDPDQIDPRPGEPVYCRPCAERLLEELQDLPRLLIRLTTDGITSPRPDTITRAQAAAPASPSPVHDVLDHAARYLVEAAAQVRDWVGQPPATTHTTGAAITDLARWWTPAMSHPATDRDLARWQCTPRNDPCKWWWRADATEFLAAGIHRLHATLSTITADRRLVHRLPEPCPACDRRSALERVDGDEHVVCRFCRRAWKWELLPHLTRAAIDTARQAQEATA